MRFERKNGRGEISLRERLKKQTEEEIKMIKRA
jgi:hypothetical protein